MLNSPIVKCCVVIFFAAYVSLSIFCPDVTLILSNLTIGAFCIIIFINPALIFRCDNLEPQEEKIDKSEEIFRRIESYFSQKKPYLKADITIDDVAKAVYTNRTYASQALNVCYKDNFRQYVNSYRISYAIEYFKKDPSKNVEDLSTASGFANTNSFSMAFKLRMNCTPSEWMNDFRSRAENSLSLPTASPSGGSNPKSYGRRENNIFDERSRQGPAP